MSPQKKIEAGSEVDSKCLKCKDVTNHTVVAMTNGKVAKVVCNVCGGRHNYRPPKPASKANPKKKAARSRGQSIKQAKAEARFEELLADRDISDAQKYDLKAVFKKGDLIDHPTFGLGVVTGTILPDKIEVTFREEDKILICGPLPPVI